MECKERGREIIDEDEQADNRIEEWKFYRSYEEI